MSNMNTSFNKNLRVTTQYDSSGDNTSPNPSPPNLSTLSSESEAAASVPFTPTDQGIMTKEVREELAKQFVTKLQLEWPDLSVSMQTRAKRIQSPDFTWSPTKHGTPRNGRYTTSFREEWKIFINRLPERHQALLADYKNVFFDEEFVANVMAIRRPKSGICCAHASVLFQHYVQSCRTGRKNHEMLDVSSFIRNNCSIEVQKQYVEKGTIGTGSFTLTQMFTGTEEHQYRQFSPCLKSQSERGHRNDIERLYEHYQETQEPGLVYGYRVDDTIFKNDVLEGPMDMAKYQQKVIDNNGKGSLHAMVLIGAYPDPEDGRFWFVLQNSHVNGYFKLVDGEHLASCRATVAFPFESTDLTLKDKYDISYGEYIETETELEECMVECVEEGAKD